MANQLTDRGLPEGGILGLERHGDRLTEHRMKQDGNGTEPAVSQFSGREHAVSAFMQKLLPALGERYLSQPYSPFPGVSIALHSSSTLLNGRYLVIETNEIADVARVWVFQNLDAATRWHQALAYQYSGMNPWQAFECARRGGPGARRAY